MYTQMHEVLGFIVVFFFKKDLFDDSMWLDDEIM